MRNLRDGSNHELLRGGGLRLPPSAPPSLLSDTAEPVWRSRGRGTRRSAAPCFDSALQRARLNSGEMRVPHGMAARGCGTRSRHCFLFGGLLTDASRRTRYHRRRCARPCLPSAPRRFTDTAESLDGAVAANLPDVALTILEREQPSVRLGQLGDVLPIRQMLPARIAAPLEAPA